MTAFKPKAQSGASASSSSSAVPYRSSRWPGRLLRWNSIFHTAVGLSMTEVRAPFLEAIQAGFVNAFEGHVHRQYAFWFLTAGIMLYPMGKLVDWYLFAEPNRLKEGPRSSDRHSSGSARPIRSDRELPKELGVWFLALSVGGAMAFPKLGFYIFGAQGLAILFAK